MRFWQRLIGPGKQPEEALKWLQMGVDADGPPSLWWKLGNLQIAQGKFDEAKVNRERAPEQSLPQAAIGVFRRRRLRRCVYADLLEAQLSQVQGHWQDATKQIRSNWRGIEVRPRLAQAAFYSQGKTYEQLADFERALKAYRQAVDADPMWMPAREAVAATLQSLGRSE